MASFHAASAGIQQAAKEARKAQHVVNLVGVVAFAGGYNARNVLDVAGRDFRLGVGHRENYSVAVHRSDVSRG
jgi:hypothetical protein